MQANMTGSRNRSQQMAHVRSSLRLPLDGAVAETESGAAAMVKVSFLSKGFQKCKQRPGGQDKRLRSQNRSQDAPLLRSAEIEIHTVHMLNADPASVILTKQCK